MREQTDYKCLNCPRIKTLKRSINQKRKIIDFSNDIRSQHEQKEQEELKAMAESFGRATTNLLNEALATQDEQYIQLTAIYTKPMVEVLSKYLEGSPVSAKDFVEACVLGALDVREAGMNESDEMQEIRNALDYVYKVDDYTTALTEKIIYYSNDLQGLMHKEEEQVNRLLSGCPGAKRSAKLLGKYTCQSPNK